MTTTSPFVRSPMQGEIRSEVEAYTREITRSCVRTLNEEMGDVLHNGVDSLLGLPWDVRVKMSWSLRRRAGRGGLDTNKRPYISIAMRRVLDDRLLIEYESFYYDREIGAMHTDWRGRAAGIVAHEVAHAAGWTLFRKTEKTWGGYPLVSFKDHGAGWKAIYRLLRQRHVNHLGSPVTRPKVDLLAAIGV